MLTVSSLAYAQPADDDAGDRLARDLRVEAEKGACEKAKALAAELRAIDSHRYATVLADARVAACVNPMVPQLPDVESPAPRSTAALNSARKSPGAALLGSVLVTLAGAPFLVAAGLYGSNHPNDPLTPVLAVIGSAAVAVGPSVGHIYVGHAWTTGLKLRAAGLGVVAATAAISSRASSRDGFATVAAVFVGGGLFLAGAIHDIATARCAALRRTSVMRR
jgi:hypothetical protein